MSQKLPPIIKTCFLMLTEQCPMACNYCFIKDRISFSEFDITQMNKVKELFTCNCKPRLIFFGGEPLLKLDLIKEIVSKYENDFIFQVVTNGLVNFDEFMESVYDKHKDIFDVQISWDVSNETRKLLNGNMTSDTVYNTIIRNLEKDRVLIGRGVIDDTSVKTLFETYKTFANLNSKYKFGADFVIAHQPNFSLKFPTILKEELEKIYSEIKNNLNKNAFIPSFLYKTIVNIKTNIKVNSCDVGNYIVIRPNGDIYPCTILSQISDEFKIGKIGENVDSSIIDDLKILSACSLDCKLRSICDGGCRYERVYNFKNHWKEDICLHTCDINQVLYDTTNSFLQSLTDVENKQLLELLKKYMNVNILYDNNVEG